MPELISVVITSYNAGKCLKQCIDSVLRQTYSNIEIIIINDGSADNTGEIASEYAEKYNSIRYFFQENSGVSVARNVGINNAGGKCIMFVDGDDYLDEHIVEQLFAEMGDSDIICCCCKAFTESETLEDHFFASSFVSRSQEEKEKLYLQLLNGNAGKPNGKGYTAIGVPWGKLYRLDFLKNNKIFFDPKLKSMQDNMFNMYAFCCAEQIKYIDKPLYYYRLEHITSKKVSYGSKIWIPFLNAREQFWKENRQISLQLKNAIQYERNIAFISIVLDETKEDGVIGAAKIIKKIRNNDMFRGNSSSCSEKEYPLKMKIFIFLARHRLDLPLALCIKLLSRK